MEPLQRTEDWYEARLGKVTASRVACLFDFWKNGNEGASRKRYREELVAERLTGMRADQDGFVSYDMKWGIANEAIAKNVYQLNTKRIIEEAPFVAHPTLACGASPDGFVGEDGLIEIKCLRSANHLFKAIKTQEVPEEYLPQIYMQLWITGRMWCDFVAFDSRLPEGLKIFVQRIDRDEDKIKVLKEGVIQFLGEVDKELKFFASLRGSYGDMAQRK